MELNMLKALKNALVFSKAEKFADYTLEDGSVIQVDGDLVVGTAVNAVAADGSVSPAPDGEHIISGVAKISTAGGVITDVLPLEEPTGSEDMAADNNAEPNKEEEMAAEMPTAPTIEEINMMISDKLAGVEAKMAELDAKISEIESKMSSLFTANFSLIEAVDTLANKPTAEPQKQNNFNAHFNEKSKNIEAKMERLLEIKKGLTN